MQSGVLLTIAIPTYNRAACLDLCLDKLTDQTDRIGKDVELIISDNASPDTTPEVVDKYRNCGLSLTYVRNQENIGADANIHQCFTMATGKYVLILADDDLLVVGAVDNIITALGSGEYGVVHMKSYSYVTDFLAEGPAYRGDLGYTVYQDKEQFIRKVNVMLTFISGNIINKTLVDPSLDIESFHSTNLVQLSWTLSALVNADSNLYINNVCIAARAENTGGYRICAVFGVNLRSILTRFEQQGVQPRIFRGIITTLLTEFLPGYILKLRRGTRGFQNEDFFRILHPVFHTEHLFWLVIVPAIKLPIPLAGAWYKIIKKGMKMSHYLRR
jgi:glycosyltransferase involved in cell wall biosynthesis